MRERGSIGAPKSRHLDTRARGRLDACPSSGLDASARCGLRAGLAHLLTSVMRRREGLTEGVTGRRRSEGVTGWRHSGWWSRRRWLPAVWQRVGQRRRPSMRAPSRLLGQPIDSLRVARQAAHTSSHAAGGSFAARAALRGAQQVGGGHSRARSTQVWAQLLDLPLAVGGGVSQLGCRYGGGHARASWGRRGCNGGGGGDGRQHTPAMATCGRRERWDCAVESREWRGRSLATADATKPAR